MSSSPLVSISTLSTMETSPWRLLRHPDPRTIDLRALNRAAYFNEIVMQQTLEIDCGPVGISYHPTGFTHVNAVMQWEEAKMYQHEDTDTDTHQLITSIDVPDVVSLFNQTKKCAQERNMIAQHIGWQLANVMSPRRQESVLCQMQSLSPTVYRTSSAGIRDGTIKFLLDHTSTPVAIEIDASLHSQNKFFDFIKDADERYPGRIRIAFDPAHMEQAEGSSALDALDTILSNHRLAPLLRIVDLDQSKNGIAHTALHGGDIDLPKIMATISDAGATIDEVIIETSPFIYDDLFTTDTEKYLTACLEPILANT